MSQSPHHTENQHDHTVGYGAYLLTWFGLLALTGITVSVAGIDVGHWVIATALGIATVKTVLVLSIFMHLKFEGVMFKLFVGIAVLTLAIFFVLMFFDYAFH